MELIKSIKTYRRRKKLLKITLFILKETNKFTLENTEVEEVLKIYNMGLEARKNIEYIVGRVNKRLD